MKACLEAGDSSAADGLKTLLRAGASEDGPTLLKRAGFDVLDSAAFAAMTRRMDKLIDALDREMEFRGISE